MKKTKVLYLTFHSEIGGGEIILLSLITKLDKKRFEPVVVVTKEGQLSNKLRGLKIKTYVLPLPGYLIRTLFIPGVSPLGIYRFYRLCQKIKPDLIHLNHLNLVLYAGISAKFLKIPVVATSHGSWDSIYIFQEILNSIFVDRILAITQKIKNALTKRKILNRSKVNVVNPGIDTEVFKPGDKNLARKKLNLPLDKIVVSIVGRIDPVKDHITFLKAAQILANKLNNIIFYIVGSKIGDFTGQKNGYLKQINNFIKTHPNLRKKIAFSGFVDDMSAVYNATDILVSTSSQESFGLAIAEGAACALPIVTTASGVFVKNGQTGFVVQPQNPKAVAEIILTLTANPKLREEFGKNAQQLINIHFQLQDYVTKIENVYLSFQINHLKSKES